MTTPIVLHQLIVSLRRPDADLRLFIEAEQVIDPTCSSPEFADIFMGASQRRD
jgi:hypothetical protein